MWEPFKLSIEEWAPNCKIVYDKFHIMQHANDAVDEVRRAEFFRKANKMSGLIKGKRWLLLSRWVNLDTGQRQLLNEFVRHEPTGNESISAEGKPGPAVELPL